MNAPAATSPTIEQVRALKPTLEKWCDEAEHLRTLPQPVFHAFHELGLFHLFLSRDLGGSEMPLDQTMATIEELARTDGSFGWTIAIAQDIALVSSRLPFTTAKAIFAERPLPVLAGSIHPPGRAERIQGGYLVSGEWALTSGCMHSSWLSGNCLLYDGEHAPGPNGQESRFFFMPRDACDIVDTWHSTGLRGTGSHHFRCHEVFVADGWECSLANESDHPGNMFRSPFFTFTRATVAAVALGIARHAVEVFCELAGGKTPRDGTTRLSDSQRVQEHLGEVEAGIRAARSFLYECAAAITATVARGEVVPREMNVVKDMAAAHAVRCATAAVEEVYILAGSSAIYAGSGLDRCLRDILTLKQHAAVGPIRFAAAGEMLMKAGGA
jgi:alkylation response protein AidB-like acyl-CoA dehydrogenase